MLLTSALPLFRTSDGFPPVPSETYTRLLLPSIPFLWFEGKLRRSQQTVGHKPKRLATQWIPSLLQVRHFPGPTLSEKSSDTGAGMPWGLSSCTGSEEQVGLGANVGALL